MRISSFLSLLLCLGCLLGGSISTSSAQAVPTPSTLPAPRAGRSFVLLIVGTPGTPLIGRHYRDWATRFQNHLSIAGVSSPDLITLSQQQDIPHRNGDATLTAIKDTLAQLGKQISRHDQLVLILIGHGDLSGSLTLPGPDISPQILAESLNAIPTEHQVILDFASCSGALIPPVQGSGRVILAANGPTETSDSDFAEFFLLALEGKLTSSATRPSVTDKDSQANLLKIFNLASHEYAQWITHQKQTETGWVVEGKSSLDIFTKLYSGADLPETRRLASGNDAPGDDSPLSLVPDKNVEFWNGRRLISEHPTLEDTGKTDGSSALGGEGYSPLKGEKPGDIGFLARQTVLGHPSPLNP